MNDPKHSPPIPDRLRVMHEAGVALAGEHGRIKGHTLRELIEEIAGLRSALEEIDSLRLDCGSDTRALARAMAIARKALDGDGRGRG